MSEFLSELKSRIRTTRREFYSPLPPETCLEHISEASFLIEGLHSTGTGDEPVLAIRRKLSVQLHKKSSMRNSFRPQVQASFSASGGGSQIVCVIGIDIIIRVFIVAWLIAAACVGMYGLLRLGASYYGQHVISGNALLLIVLAFAMPILGGAVFNYGVALASDDETFLIDFLRQTAQAAEKSVAPGWR